MAYSPGLNRRLRIGFVVNPVAGSGILMRFNGSDSIQYSSNWSYSIRRSISFLELLGDDFQFFTCSESMGENSLKSAGIDNYEIIYSYKGKSSSDDTTNFCQKAKDIVDLIVFVGGDGTATSVARANPQIPVLGIPAGMKMYSSVYADSPLDGAQIVKSFALGENIAIREGVVEDVDESLIKEDIFKINDKYKLKTLTFVNYRRDPKMELDTYDDESISQYIIDNMDDSFYLIGTGSTCKAIMDSLGLETSIFSVDLIKDKKLIKADYYPSDFNIVKDSGLKLKIVVSPYAGSGFFLGRGNRQISAEAVKYAGKDGVIIVGTEEKMNTIDELKFDVQGLERDFFGNYKRVITGYGKGVVKRLHHLDA